jgi:hypothetical protein
MTKTENLQLPQWEAEDYVQRSDFNEAFAALDEGYALAVGSASKAWEASADKVTQEALAQLQTVVDTKAGQEDLTALTARHDSDLADVQAALALRGNCQFSMGSYVGKGGYGSANKCVLTFTRLPKLLILGIGATNTYILLRGVTTAKSSSNSIAVTWGTNTISWSGQTTEGQCNTENSTYHYAAFCDMAE